MAENTEETQKNNAAEKAQKETAQTQKETAAAASTSAPSKEKKPLSLLMQLKAQKDALLEEAKSLNSQIPQLRSQLAPLAAELKTSKHANSSRLRSQIEEIEFEIATAAFTAKQEKELIKLKKELEAQLKTSSAAEALFKQATALRSTLKSLLSRRREIDAQLDSLRSQMNSEYEKSVKEREKRAYEYLKLKYGKKTAEGSTASRAALSKKAPESQIPASAGKEPAASPSKGGKKFIPKSLRREKLGEEEAKYLKKHDEFVSLQDIVIIEKKEIEKKEKAAPAEEKEGTA